MKKLDRILPTGDLAIKKVLASEENKDILAGLIWDFFEVDAQNLNIISPYNIVSFRELVKGEDTAVMRQTIKDVAATFKTADFVSEAQVRRAGFFDERSLLYPLERFCSNYNKTGHMVLNAMGKPLRYSSLLREFSIYSLFLFR